jgi:hypothetical protein
LTDFATVGDLDLGDTRGVDREYALHAFAVGNLADSESGVHSGTAAGDHEAGEDLDTLFATFNNAAMDLHGISDIELGDILFQLLCFDLLDDIHGVLLRGKLMCCRVSVRCALTRGAGELEDLFRLCNSKKGATAKMVRISVLPVNRCRIE